MSLWVLLLVFKVSTGNSIAAVSQEFDGREACINALAEVRKSMPGFQGGVCVPKAMPR